MIDLIERKRRKEHYKQAIKNFKVGCKVKLNGEVLLGRWNDIRTIIAIEECEYEHKNRYRSSSCIYCIGKIKLDDNAKARCISSSFKIGLDIVAEPDFFKEEEFMI